MDASTAALAGSMVAAVGATVTAFVNRPAIKRMEVNAAKTESNTAKTGNGFADRVTDGLQAIQVDVGYLRGKLDAHVQGSADIQRTLERDVAAAVMVSDAARIEAKAARLAAESSAGQVLEALEAARIDRARVLEAVVSHVDEPPQT